MCVNSRMDFRLSEDQELLRQSVREFAEAEIRPHVASGTRRSISRGAVPKLAALGLMGIQFPEEYGGAGMSAIDYCICIEELARVDPSVALSVAAHNGLCTAHIGCSAPRRRSSDTSRRSRAARKLGAWGLTEADRRQRRGGHADDRRARWRSWVINGTKVHTTAASATSWSSWR